MTEAEFKIELTLGAQKDLRDIYTLVSEIRSIVAADQTIDTLIKKVELLKMFPERGHVSAELISLGHNEYKQIISKPYRIFYRVINKTVFIAAVLDGRRDIPTLLERRLLRN